MSHLVKITTTNTTNTSYTVLYTGNLKTCPGILKLIEFLIGAVCVGIFSCYSTRGVVTGSYDQFFFLMVTSFMIGTFCLLLACLTSLHTGSIISKTNYELIYHGIAASLLFSSSMLLFIRLRDSRIYKGYEQYDFYLAASIMGLANSILYFVSAFLACRS